MAQQLPFQNGQCIYLDENTPCGPSYKGYPVQANDQAFVDYAHFVTWITSLTDINNFVSNAQQKYQCTAGDALTTAATDLRYQLSYWCSYASFLGISAGCALPDGVQGLNANGQLLCAAQCKISGDSINAVLGNANLCAAAAGAGAQRVSTWNAVCASENPQAGTCVAGTGNEAIYCGFRDKATALAVCPTLVNSDQCCNAFMAAQASQTQATVSPTTTGPAANASKSSSPSLVGPIAGAVGGIVVVAAAVIGFLYYRRRRGSQNQGQVKPAPTSPIAMEDMNGNQPRGFYQNKPQQPQQQQQQAYGNMNNGASGSSSFGKVQYHGSSGNAGMGSGMTSPQTPPASYGQQQQVQQQQQQSQSYQQPSSLSGSIIPVGIAAATAAATRDSTVTTNTATTSTTNANETLMKIIHPYAPSLADELSLELGQEVILLRPFDDGWALGMNPITGQQGAFPLVCVVPIDQASKNRASLAPSEVDVTRFSKRVSSISIQGLAQSSNLNSNANLFPPEPSNNISVKPISAVPGHLQQQYHPRASTVSTTNTPATPADEYFRKNGYDPLLDEGLKSARSSMAPSVAGLPVPSGLPPPVPNNGKSERAVKFDSVLKPPVVHVYQRPDSVAASEFSEAGFGQQGGRQ
ncbi:hypothetical protein HDU76_012707 [Blyttiomyces sp. JEL0837]|nr:hypothetical protein HDU76_012707 [Blyttiomyces sp. JEL0837]